MKKCIFFITLFIAVLSCGESNAIETVVDQSFLEVDLPKGNIVTASSQRKVVHIPVKTNINWETQMPEGIDWYSAESRFDDTNNLMILTILENQEVGTREGSFVLKGAGIADVTINIIQLGQSPDIISDHIDKTAPSEGEVFNITVTASVDYNVSTTSSLDWIEIKKIESRAMVATEYEITVNRNPTAIERKDTIIISPKDAMYNDLTLEIPVVQGATLIEDVIPSDIQVALQSVSLTRGNTYGSESAAKSMDGVYSTHYSSSSTGTGDSIILDYTLKGGAERVDLVKLIQRADQNSGSIFSSGSVWYKSESELDWKFANIIAEFNPQMQLNSGL